jgi:hypothetical protein
MPLEDLTGNKYISDLNEAWPDGSRDFLDAGDNHLRGVKNVLKRTFPYITGPVDLTQSELYQGTVPAGAVMTFYMAAAPEGWVRVQGITTDYMMRAVPTSSEDGGATGGTHNPILNNLVPSHTHGVSGTVAPETQNHVHGVSGNTGGNSVGHHHYVNFNSGTDWPDHVHNLSGMRIPLPSGGSGFSAGAGLVYTDNPNTGGASTRHQHTISGNTGGVSANHTHYFSVTSGGRNTAHNHTFSVTSAGNGGAANWQPRYMNMILCTKSARAH